LRTDSSVRRYVTQSLLEITFCSGAALLVTWVGSVVSWPHGLFFSFTERLQTLLFHPYPYSDNAALRNRTFFIAAGLLALVFWGLVRLIRDTSFGVYFRHTFAGIFAITSVPFVWFFLTYDSVLVLSSQTLGRKLFPFEVGAALISVLLYRGGRWFSSRLLNVLLLTLHYGLWGWIVWEHFFPNPLAPVFAFLGPVCGVTWCIYINDWNTWRMESDCRLRGSK